MVLTLHICTAYDIHKTFEYTFQFLVHFQIKLSIMGNGNNQITNDMEEVAKELTISSLRGSQVNINLDDFEGDSLKSHPFPVFHRKSFIGSNNVRKTLKSTNLIFCTLVMRNQQRFLKALLVFETEPDRMLYLSIKAKVLLFFLLFVPLTKSTFL